MRTTVVFLLILVAGCDRVPGMFAAPEPAAPAVAPAPAEPAAPEAVARSGAVRSGRLGVTVAALGDPARAGAWMETPLVSVEQPGQVRHAGKSLPVTLIPAGGPATGGSRLSLSAMQALGLPLTDLSEVEVFGGALVRVGSTHSGW